MTEFFILWSYIGFVLFILSVWNVTSTGVRPPVWYTLTSFILAGPVVWLLALTVFAKLMLTSSG